MKISCLIVVGVFACILQKACGFNPGVNTSLVITCPDPVAVTSLANKIGNSAIWNPPTCVAAEDGTITISVCVPASGSFFQGVGVNTVTCTCTDSGGLSDECTFPVSVIGVNTSPVITCPDPVAVTSLANKIGNSATWNPPTCVDAEDGTITTSVCVPASGSFFLGVGVNTVTSTCTDSGGLSDECTFPLSVVATACYLPADSGPCLAYIPRYYYDAGASQCQDFIFGGCGGNENNFASEGDCLAECGGSPPSFSDLCILPSVPGPCRGFFPRVFYDINTSQCQEFIYGGCGGNQNNFRSVQECQSACG